MNDLEDWVLFGTLKVLNNKKEKIIKECVFTIDKKEYKGQNIIEIIDFIKLSKRHNNKNFHKGIVNDEVRNKITGTYE